MTLSKTKKSVLASAFALAAMTLTACDGTPSGPYYVNSVASVAADKKEALEDVLLMEGTFYIFDYKNKRAILVANDKTAIGSPKLFHMEKDLSWYPQSVQDKFDEVSDLIRNTEGKVQKPFAVYRVSTKSPGFIQYHSPSLVLAEPLSKLLCVINTTDGYTTDVTKPLQGRCDKAEKFPESAQKIYRQKLGLDNSATNGPK